MTLALRLGARNLLRAPRRSALTVAAGAGGLAVAMLLVNLARGISERAVDGAVRLGPGHLSVHRAGYLPLGDATREIPGATDITQRLAALPGVLSALPRLSVPGLARAGPTTRAVVLIGIDPAREAATSPLAHRVARGVFLGRGDPNGLLLGAALAQEFAVRVGDAVLLSAPGGHDAGGERTLRVAGILDRSLDEIAPGAVWTALPVAQAIAGRTDTAHEIAVFLASSSPAALADAGARIAAIAGSGNGLEVATWQEVLPQLRDALALDALTRSVLILGLFGIVAIGVAATLLASILERTRELGLLLALGTPPALLRRMVLAEGALLGLCAVAIGLAGGAAATAALAHVGLDARASFSEEIAYGGALFSLKIYPAWDWTQTTRAVLLLFAVHLAAAAWPAWRAGATAPAAALRFR
jgi:ABC-type lipoprotein release transport system permease subunit